VYDDGVDEPGGWEFSLSGKFKARGLRCVMWRSGLLLASYRLFDDKLPPAIVDSLWHSGFSAYRNPFAMCYYARRLSVSKDDEQKACRYLQQFGRTKEEQVRSFYLWAQTVPLPFWRYFNLLPLTRFGEAVSDMVPPLAMSNIIRHLDLYHYFKGATVLDLFSGVCGWLMSFIYFPPHYLPYKWIAVDIDSHRLQICRLVAKDIGVDIETIKYDLSRPYVRSVDIVVGSPPCHEFSSANISRPRYVERGLTLVKSYLESVNMINPRLAIMEEATTTSSSAKLVVNLLVKYGFSYSFFNLRNYGAIQNNRYRLIAWKHRNK
jgi:hypothetical protein